MFKSKNKVGIEERFFDFLLVHNWSKTEAFICQHFHRWRIAKNYQPQTNCHYRKCRCGRVFWWPRQALKSEKSQ